MINNEDDPTTIPPAIGAWIMSLIISSPLRKFAMTIVPMIDAPIPVIMEGGAFKRLKMLNLLLTSI